MSFRPYNVEMWDRRRHIIRGLFTEPPVLSPIPEHPTSRPVFAPSEEIDYDLPALKIEREPNRHDETKEYYDRLQIKMRRYYRKIFRGEEVLSCSDEFDLDAYPDNASTLILEEFAASDKDIDFDLTKNDEELKSTVDDGNCEEENTSDSDGDSEEQALQYDDDGADDAHKITQDFSTSSYYSQSDRRKELYHAIIEEINIAKKESDENEDNNNNDDRMQLSSTSKDDGTDTEESSTNIIDNVQKEYNIVYKKTESKDIYKDMIEEINVSNRDTEGNDISFDNDDNNCFYERKLLSTIREEDEISAEDVNGKSKEIVYISNTEQNNNRNDAINKNKVSFINDDLELPTDVYEFNEEYIDPITKYQSLVTTRTVREDFKDISDNNDVHNSEIINISNTTLPTKESLNKIKIISDIVLVPATNQLPSKKPTIILNVEIQEDNETAIIEPNKSPETSSIRIEDKYEDSFENKINSSEYTSVSATDKIEETDLSIKQTDSETGMVNSNETDSECIIYDDCEEIIQEHGIKVGVLENKIDRANLIKTVDCKKTISDDINNNNENNDNSHEDIGEAEDLETETSNEYTLNIQKFMGEENSEDPSEISVDDNSDEQRQETTVDEIEVMRCHTPLSHGSIDREYSMNPESSPILPLNLTRKRKLSHPILPKRIRLTLSPQFIETPENFTRAKVTEHDFEQLLSRSSQALYEKRLSKRCCSEPLPNIPQKKRMKDNEQQTEEKRLKDAETQIDEDFKFFWGDKRYCFYFL